MSGFLAFWNGLGTIGKTIQLVMIALIAGLAVFVYLFIHTHNDIVTGLAARAAAAVASREATIATLTSANADNIRALQAAQDDRKRSQEALEHEGAYSAQLAAELARIQQENRDARPSPAHGCPIIERTARELWPAH